MAPPLRTAFDPLAAAFAAACAFAAAMPAQDALEERIQRALHLARKPLLAGLANSADDPGQLGLLCLAALHDSVPLDEKVLADALARLADARIEATYALALRLLVAEACAKFADRERHAAKDYAALLRNRDSGPFGYSPDAPRWDLSNTQYAALGLRAAASLGVDVPRKVWTALADAVMDSQHNGGGFSYQPNQEVTASMTAAGIGVLAICRQAMVAPGRRIPELDRRIDKAWKWLAEHKSVVGDGAIAWSYYFHYGLERASILCDRTDIGGVDWYRQGATMFVDEQLADGGWASPHGRAFVRPGSAVSPVDTAFAVLFLRRRFQKVPTPLTEERRVVLAALDEHAPPTAVDACVEGLVKRGKECLPEVLQALRSEFATRRRACVRALAAIAGETFGLDPELDATANQEALRRAELWYLKHR
jgi:hypothetical protein